MRSNDVDILKSSHLIHIHEACIKHSDGHSLSLKAHVVQLPTIEILQLCLSHTIIIMYGRVEHLQV